MVVQVSRAVVIVEGGTRLVEGRGRRFDALVGLAGRAHGESSLARRLRQTTQGGAEGLARRVGLLADRRFLGLGSRFEGPPSCVDRIDGSALYGQLLLRLGQPLFHDAQG